MHPSRRRFIIGSAVLALTAVPVPVLGQTDPLPSWNDGATKSAIMEFVSRVTREGGPDFVPVAERITTFDNDGTLWCEHPYYVQLQFVLDRIREMAPATRWREPFKGVLDNNLHEVMAQSEEGVIKLLMVTHAGTTVDEFAVLVSDWIAKARHPRFQRPYNSLVYQPMLELLGYLRANSFQTWIASGGGVEFMRPWAPEAYGIPPQQIIGSSIKTAFKLQNGKPVLTRLPEIGFINDKGGKPVGINSAIGRRPIAAFGNSDGDLQMLQWTTTGAGPRFGLLVRHDDAEREYAYDRATPVGRLDQALDAAGPAGWTVVSMQHDWRTMFPAL